MFTSVDLILISSFWFVAHGNTAWYEVYEGARCEKTTAIASSILDYSNCVTIDIQSLNVSARIFCADGTSESAWLTEIYSSDDCSGRAIGQIGSDSSCACENVDEYGLSMNVNCAGIVPICSSDTGVEIEESFNVYVAAYLNSDCDTDDLLISTSLSNERCIAYGAGSTATSVKIFCDSPEESSPWTVLVYSNGACSGSSVTQTSGDNWKDCGAVTTFGTPLSFHVNCANTEKKSYVQDATDDDGGGGLSGTWMVVVIVIGSVAGIVLLILVIRPTLMSASSGNDDATIGKNTTNQADSHPPTPTASPMQSSDIFEL